MQWRPWAAEASGMEWTEATLRLGKSPTCPAPPPSSALCHSWSGCHPLTPGYGPHALPAAGSGCPSLLRAPHGTGRAPRIKVPPRKTEGSGQAQTEHYVPASVLPPSVEKPFCINRRPTQSLTDIATSHSDEGTASHLRLPQMTVDSEILRN